jgi:hypothetical protein
VPAPPAGAVAGDAFVTPRVALAPDGAAVALWAAQAGGAWVVRGARLAAGTSAWQEMPGPPLDPGLPAPPRYGPPGIALGPAGDAVVLWTVPSATASGVSALRAARRAGVGDWGAPVTVADPVGGAGRPAVSADGRAAVVWTGAGTAPPSPVLVAVGAPGAAGFGASEVLPAAAWGTAAAINSRGDLLVAWSGLNEGETHAAVRPAGGTWGPTLTARGGILPTIGYAGSRVALDEAGTAHVGAFFEDQNALAHQWPFSVVTGTAAGWGSPRTISYGGGDSAIATAPDGTAIVLVRGGDPGTIWAASYDGLPDVGVTAQPRGRWTAGGRCVRWTVRVRNVGRIAAQGVRLRLRADSGDRFVARRPRAAIPAGRTSVWRLGRLAPGATRTIVAVVRPRNREDGVGLQATVFAAGMPPVWVGAPRVGPPR